MTLRHLDGGSEELVSWLTRERDEYMRRAVELDRQVFVLRSLLQSGKGFSEILEIDSLLDAFMAVCRERCGVSNSAVLLKDDLDPDTTFYRIRAYHGLPDTFVDHDGTEEELLMFRIPQDRGLLWQQVRQGDVFSVRDMQGQPRFSTAWDTWNLQALQSSVWCPLRKGNGGEVLGILCLGDPEPGRHISETEYMFLQELCAVAATNIDSTLKYTKNLQILQNLRTLYDINQKLANVNDFKELTIETLSRAVEAMNAQKANLMLLDPETGKLEIKVVWGNIPEATRDAINSGQIATKGFAIGEGVAGQAALRKSPVRLNHRSQISQVSKNPVHCIMAVPLLHGGEIMGVLNMTNKVHRPVLSDDTLSDDWQLDPLGRFTETDEQLAQGLADQAAVNLHKARLYDLSITDRLTSLKNARHFEERLERAIEHSLSSGEPFTLAVTDIDHFKRFNDTYGHEAGDAVLAETAKSLDRCARAHGGVAFRYGGEEFCLLLPGARTLDAQAVLDEWRQTVEAHIVAFDDRELRVTVSVGLCEFPLACDDGGQLFRAADKALFASKEGGRNRVTAVEVEVEDAHAGLRIA